MSQSARQVTNSLKIFTWSSVAVSHRRTPNTMIKSNAGHTMIYKRLRIEQHEPQSGVNSFASEELAVPVPLISSVIVLLLYIQP